MAQLSHLPKALRSKRQAIIERSLPFPPEDQVLSVRGMVRTLIEGKVSPELEELKRKYWDLRHPPVGPREFLLSRKFLNRRSEVYPEVLEEFVRMNSGNYTEVVLTGGIGTAKTTLAIWTSAYQLYWLSCIRSPQKFFGLQSSDEILFVFQSLNERLAKSLNFERFRHLLLDSPYFRNEFKFDTSIESELRFPNRIMVRPVTGAATAAIGQNVFGGILDEVNFMATTENSKQSVDGGSYDQAISLYNTISRRRKSRFMHQGKVPGIFCIVSSKRYPGEFTDVKIEEAKTDKTIYVYDKKPWDVLPPERFSGKWFNVFIGDLTRKPRIMDEGETMAEADSHLVEPIPEDYRTEFQTDIMNALRDIAGVSTLARFPFIMNNEAVAQCFGTTDSVLSRVECDFTSTRLAILPKRIRDTEFPRFVHIDLGVTGDAAGVACGYVPEFKEIEVAEGVVERLPVVQYDFTLRVTPPRGDEIQFHKIRDLLYKLRQQGLPIKWVTLDSFQSRDMIQTLRTKGFICGMVSVDTDTLPYDMLKTGFYQGRITTPQHEHAERELVSLERDPKKNKIDHPPQGSKDVADAMAGVAYGLTMRRDVWLQHGISLFEIPDTLKQMVVKNDHRLQASDADGHRIANAG